MVGRDFDENNTPEVRLKREVNTTIQLEEHRMTRRPMKMFSGKHPIKIRTLNVRKSTSGMTTLTTGHTIIYPVNSDANDIHYKGVGLC